MDHRLFLALRREQRFFKLTETLEAQTQDRVINPEIRARNDVETFLAEALNGNMTTSFYYRYDKNNEELVAEDGELISNIFENAILDAEQVIIKNPQLQFEVRRRKEEKNELEAMLSMMNGNLPNTMVVLSDFPEELMNSTDNVGGYNVSRKQTMLRIISKQEDGISVASRTLDGSYRVALEEIYASLEQPKPKRGELLGQRIHLDLNELEQAILIDKIVSTYDSTLHELTGVSYSAGMPLVDLDTRINTYDFVRQQNDLVNIAVRQVLSGDLSVSPYAIVAAMTERYENIVTTRIFDTGTIISGDIAIREFALMQEIHGAGRRASIDKKVFNGCGSTLVPDEFSVEDQLETSGYGNKTDKETKYDFNKKMYCVDCQAPPKEKEAKKWCGPCGLCRGCDKKYGGKG